MANQRKRHFHGQVYVFLKGDPPEEIPHFYYIKEAAGYWLLLWKMIALAKEKAQRALDARRAMRPLRGKGSGRAGGGRGAAHNRFHLRHGELNWDTLPEECPICYDKRRWKIWKQSDYGQLPEWKDLLKPEVPRYAWSKKDHAYHLVKTRKPFSKLRMDAIDDFFDSYMRTHRFEHFHEKVNMAHCFEKPVYRWEVEYDVFLMFGCPGVYDRPSTHGGLISTKNHIPITRFDRLLTEGKVAIGETIQNG